MQKVPCPNELRSRDHCTSRKAQSAPPVDSTRTGSLESAVLPRSLPPSLIRFFPNFPEGHKITCRAIIHSRKTQSSESVQWSSRGSGRKDFHSQKGKKNTFLLRLRIYSFSFFLHAIHPAVATQQVVSPVSTTPQVTENIFVPTLKPSFDKD